MTTLTEGRVGLILARDAMRVVVRLVEWRSTGDCLLTLLLVDWAFRTRWIIQVWIPVMLLLQLPAIQDYWHGIAHSCPTSSLDLLLEMKTLAQEVLDLRQRLQTAFREEIKLMSKLLGGRMELRIRFLLIVLVIVFSGWLSCAMTGVELAVLWLLVRESQAGRFYRQLLASCGPFVDFSCFYAQIFCQTDMRGRAFHPSPKDPAVVLFHSPLVVISRDEGDQSFFQVTVTIWENERWWMGAGWSSTLLRTDGRGSLSDVHGVVSYAHDFVRHLDANVLCDMERQTGMTQRMR